MAGVPQGQPLGTRRLDRQAPVARPSGTRRSSAWPQRAEWLRGGSLPALRCPPASLLAISGGGDAGAFAAGIPAAWTLHGNRPQFRVVTGISTGALIAPFAFLGSRYDDLIRRVFTSLRAEDVFRRRNMLIGLASDGMADNEPFSRLVAEYVTPQILAAVADEYAKDAYSRSEQPISTPGVR